jgi:Abortive infection C-terminus
MSGLTRQEVLKLVNDYIGVEGGYLGDFSYSSHAEFYPYFCGLDGINPNEIDGTTRQRFIYILENASPLEQAKILRGTLAKFQPSSNYPNRTPERIAEIESWARRCEGIVVQGKILSTTSDVVSQAINDADVLIRENGATSGVDRIHTALHGYLIGICAQAGIPHEKDATLTSLFKLLRKQHKDLQPTGPRSQEISTILNAFASIVDAFNPVRNKASIAHPNPLLLDEDEALLVINTARTLLQYLSRKFK